MEHSGYKVCWASSIVHMRDFGHQGITGVEDNKMGITGMGLMDVGHNVHTVECNRYG